MPELPEVETICRGLRALLPGRKVTEVELKEPRLRKTVNSGFPSQLHGRTILGVERRGKYILVLLEGDRIWLSHLGMSGKLIYVNAERPQAKHDHIIVKLNGGCEVRYNDPRRFGLSMVVLRSELDSLPQMRNLGPDPLDHQFDGAYLYSIGCRSKRRVRDFLIDQRVVAGVGNIYANEALFRAGIRPTKRASSIGRSGMAAISERLRELLREAIGWCGTSFSDYRDAEDRFGEFQTHLRVYNRAGERCGVCGSVIKRVRMGNRSGFYCPKCQQ